MNKRIFLLIFAIFSSNYLLAQLSNQEQAAQKTRFAQIMEEQQAKQQTPLSQEVENPIEESAQAIPKTTVLPMQNEPIKATNSKQIKVKTKDWGPQFSSLENLFGQATQDRKELNDLRQRNMDRYFAIRDTQNPNFAQLARDITEETIDYVKKRITQTVIELGPPPADFAIFTMGSMARQESGFYTDLEIGVMVKEKNIKVIKYFEKFAQKLSDRFFLLGEHPDVGGKGLRMDEADNSPAHLKFFARYACEEQTKSLLKSALEKREFDKIPFEGSRIFIATPEEFAQHVNPNYLTEQEKIQTDVEDALIKEELQKALKDPANRGRDASDLTKEIKGYVKILLRPLNPREKQISGSLESLIKNIRFLYGDKRLFDEYMRIREEYLSGQPKNKNPFYATRRQEIAFLDMKTDLIKHMNKPESPIITGKLGKEIDIKRELYRFPEQILTNLGFWYNLGTQNTTDIAKLLAQKGIMNQELSNQLVDLMNYFIGLRLKKQEICRKQTHALPTTLEEYNDQKEELESELQKLNKQRDFMIQSNSPAANIEKIDKDISKVQSSLIELRKLKPLEATSILSPEEITKLNTKYLPILQKLYEAAKAFILGNKNAFLEVKSTTAPSLVKEGPITNTALEALFKSGQTDAIIAALENGKISPQLVYLLAMQNKMPEIAKRASQKILKKQSRQ